MSGVLIECPYCGKRHDHDAPCPRWPNSFLVGALCAVVMACVPQGAHADDRHTQRREQQHNYIIERQQAYQVQGVPTQRLIIGRREIDIYRNGVMFERNNVIGVRP